MLETSSRAAKRLCVLCRRIERISEPCPRLQALATTSNNVVIEPLEFTGQFSSEDADLLNSLRLEPSTLCPRCSKYDIVDVFKTAEPNDEQTRLNRDDHRKYLDEFSRFEMRFGPVSSLHLTPSCQFCRLLYRIIPHQSLNPADDTLKVVPFRSYIRKTGWEQLSAATRSQCAIMLGIHQLNLLTAPGRSIQKDGANIHFALMNGGAIAMASSQTLPSKSRFNARQINDLFDFSAINKAIDICNTTHGSRCRAEWPSEMATVSVVDVVNREVVRCPHRCEYVALSYVLGGVLPSAGALKQHTLPRTVEDAITIAKKLGLRYLWVDVLCIDQDPNPSPEVARAKQNQFRIMHLIYQCASIVIINVGGKDSNSGLPGVSSAFPRYFQNNETIDGHGFFTVPVEHVAEGESSLWQTRAWTLQEGFFARRSLYLSANQAYFECSELAIPESDDIDTYPEEWTESYDHTDQSILDSLVKYGDGDPDLLAKSAVEPLNVYEGLIMQYTSRRMTKEEDSLNACLGMLSALEVRLFPWGFSYGLPVRSHLQSLAWMHDRKCSPKRRTPFPSWAWAGWEGEVTFPDIVKGGRDKKFISLARDMVVQFVDIRGQELTLHGWVASLNIRTEPFSEAFDADDKVIGFVRERNFLHNNTLPSGNYSCLVVARELYKIKESSPQKETAILLVLDWEGQIGRRKTLVTLNTFPETSLMQADITKRTIRLV